MIEIRIPPVLRPDTGGARTVSVEASTVGEAIAALVGAHPSLDGRVREGDGVPTFLNVFVDGEDIRLLQGLETPVRPGAKVLLLPAVAGGSRPLDAGPAVGYAHRSMPRATMKPILLLMVIACAPMA